MGQTSKCKICKGRIRKTSPSLRFRDFIQGKFKTISFHRKCFETQFVILPKNQVMSADDAKKKIIAEMQKSNDNTEDIEEPGPVIKVKEGTPLSEVIPELKKQE